MANGYVIVDMDAGTVYNPYSKRFEGVIRSAHIYREVTRYRRGIKCVIPSAACEIAHANLHADEVERRIELHSLDSLRREQEIFPQLRDLEIPA